MARHRNRCARPAAAPPIAPHTELRARSDRARPVPRSPPPASPSARVSSRTHASPALCAGLSMIGDNFPSAARFFAAAFEASADFCAAFAAAAAAFALAAATVDFAAFAAAAAAATSISIACRNRRRQNRRPRRRRLRRQRCRCHRRRRRRPRSGAPPPSPAPRPRPRVAAARRARTHSLPRAFCAGAVEEPLRPLERQQWQREAGDGRRASLGGLHGAREGLVRAGEGRWGGRSACGCGMGQVSCGGAQHSAFYLLFLCARCTCGCFAL